MDLDWNNCVPLLLCFSNQLTDLLLMKKKLSGPRWIMIKTVALIIMTNMHIHNPGFVVTNLDESFFQLNFSCANRFNFSSLKDNACFNCIFNRIIEIRFLFLARMFPFPFAISYSPNACREQEVSHRHYFLFLGFLFGFLATPS